MKDFKHKPYLEDKKDEELSFRETLRGAEGGNTYGAMMTRDKTSRGSDRSDNRDNFREMRKPYLGDEYREMEYIPHPSGGSGGCVPCGSIEWDDNSDETVAPSGVASVSVLGCENTVYKWEVSGSGFSFPIKFTTGTDNQLVAGPTACGTAVIAVTDTCTNESATGEVRSTSGKWVEIASGTIDDPLPIYFTGIPEGGWEPCPEDPDISMIQFVTAIPYVWISGGKKQTGTLQNISYGPWGTNCTPCNINYGLAHENIVNMPGAAGCACANAWDKGCQANCWNYDGPSGGAICTILWIFKWYNWTC